MAPDEARYMDSIKAERRETKKHRSLILDDAKKCVTQDRNKAYGEPKENHENIARGWSVILGHEVKPHQVVMCMTWLKMARLLATPDHRDSWVDACGYMSMGMETLDD